MMKRLGWLCLAALLVLGSAVVATGQDTPPTIDLLLVDGTKTFTSTMKVAATIGALRQMGLFEVSVRLSDVETDYADPLYGVEQDAGEGPFDLILILPRGLDTKTDVSIWVVSDGLSLISPFVRGAVDLLSNIVDQVFAGSGHAVDVSEDLWPSVLWSIYSANGWVK